MSKVSDEIKEQYLAMRGVSYDLTVGDTRCQFTRTEITDKQLERIPIMHKNKEWTMLEEQTVKSEWNRLQNKLPDKGAFDKKVAKQLRRTPRAIQAKRLEMQLYFLNRMPKDINKGEPRKWEPFEITTLKRYCIKYSYRKDLLFHASNALNRTPQSIKSQLRKMNLKYQAK